MQLLRLTVPARPSQSWEQAEFSLRTSRASAAFLVYPATPAFTTVLATTADPGLCTNNTTTSPFCTLDDQVENALDVEWSGAVAKKAQVVLVVSGATSASTDTVFLSASYAIQHNTAKILNVSYGLCELGMGTTGNTSYNNLWQTAASAGIAVFAASGDSGSPACDQGQATSTPYGAQYGLSVSGLASPQYVTAVGGTDFNWGRIDSGPLLERDQQCHHRRECSGIHAGDSVERFLHECPGFDVFPVTRDTTAGYSAITPRQAQQTSSRDAILQRSGRQQSSAWVARIPPLS